MFIFVSLYNCFIRFLLEYLREENDSADEVKALQIEADTWNTDIMVSADEKIYISFDGSISDGEKTSVIFQNGTLSVVQHCIYERQGLYRLC